MKRKVALIMAVFMLTMCLAPTFAFAESDQGLENAIKSTKEKFTIPNNFTEFNYNIFTENNKPVWSLNWNSKEGLDGNMSVRIDNAGNILSYNYYKPYQYEQRKLPKFSKQDAKVKAEQFIKHIHPEIVSQLKYMENNQTTLMEPTYYFSYIRLVNGIPFSNDNVSIEVSRETGEVQSFYYHWTPNLTFPNAEKAISVEEAQKAYKEKLGLRLVYNYTYDDEVLNTYALYTPKYLSNYYIDALTGDKVNLAPFYYGGGRGGYPGDMGMYAKNESKADQAILSPEELNAVEEASKLISLQSAEKTARNFKSLELTSDLKLTSSNLTRDWPIKQDFSWHLYFTKEPQNNNNEYRHSSIRINAKTGEIKGFYVNAPYNGDKKPVYDEAASKTAVEKFIKELQPAKFKEVEFDDTYNGNIIIYNDDEKPTQYSFRYVRKVNDALFPSNYINVTYDAVNGKIINYETEWYDIEFASIDNVMSLDEIYNKMFTEIGLELQYKLKYTDNTAKIIYPGPSSENAEVKLVYAPNEKKPILLDANTGTVLNYDGKPYKENKPAEYTDIDGHFAQSQINVLAEYGIAFEGTKFKPEQDITQRDFLLLLSKTLNYYGVYPVSDDNKKETDELYRYLIREGIVKENEKTPESNITREDSIKFLIRALRYDKVADIKGIFNCTFKDVKNIHPDLVGYVAIAQGLKIISGNDGYFNPKNKLTRAEAAVLIYNYLQR
ncbi:MAG: S-layer homology domain-containing protein [Clostridia bacterium]